MKTIEATVFHKPNARKETIEISAITESDAQFIIDNNIKVSLEEGVGGMIVYFDYGAESDGEPDEYIELSMGRTSEETFESAVTNLKKII